MIRDIGKIPNLISLGRLVLLVPTAYFLSQPGDAAKVYALACLAVAAISDYLDGFFARILHQQTRLGLLLDPLSDKILAGTLTVLLIIYRGFPIWLAAVIIGRDLLIAGGGLRVRSRLDGIPPSTLSGKYCFASIAVLLVSYVIVFDFGIRLTIITTLTLTAISLIAYTHRFVRSMQGQPLPQFHDRPAYRTGRIIATTALSTVYMVRLLMDIGWI